MQRSPIGGAILVNQDCTVKVENCTIEDCIADSGGAIGCYADGTVELTDTDIKTCESTSNSGGAGGGAIYTKGNLTITGGTVENCTAEKFGGGIYTQGTLTMNNCTLTDNKAKPNGGGVYVGKNGKFTMKGSSRITPSTAPNKGKNDVFLAGTSKITIDGVLSPVDGIAARITPTSYGNNVKVLDGTSELLNSEHGKFKVTPKNGGGWKVDHTGHLYEG